MWRLVLLLMLLLAAPVRADMFQDGSNAALPGAQINLGTQAVGNPAKFDPLCDGRTTEAEINAGTAHDCTAAINSAAAVTVNGMAVNVQLQPGKYYITNTISLLQGQTLIGAGRAKTYLKIRDTFNPAAQGVIALAAATADNGQFGGLRDLSISFLQPNNQASRANFQLLGTCTSALAGTGCKYPPAVLLASGRAFFDRVKIEKAWDGIASDSVGTVNSPGGTGGATINIHDMHMSAFNVGLWIDGPNDSSYIERFHFWTFGFNATTPLYGVFTDGGTDCMRIGAVDGFDGVNLFCHGSNMRFVDSVADPGDAPAAIHLTNITFDHGARFIVEASFNINVMNMLQSGDSLATPPNCSLTVNAVPARPSDRVMITGYWVQNHTETPICVYNGVLQMEQVRVIDFVDKPSVIIDGGTLYMRNAVWPTSGVTPRTAPVIWQKSGTTVLSGHTMTGPSAGGGGIALQIDTNSTHTVTDLNLGGYGISLGCGATAGYCFNAAPVGLYDLPDYAFSHTVTPTFTGGTDFVPANKGTNGQWWLRGNRVEFWLREEFDTNAYTTGNNFILQTTMPISSQGLGSSKTCVAQRFDKVTWTVPPRCAIGDNAGGTASDISFNFPVSGGTITQMARTDMPASTADFLFAISGWYPIR